MQLPYSLDFTRLSAAYARGELTPERVLRDISGAIATHADNPAWIYVVPPEELAAQAQALQARRAAGEALPLYGLPFAVKDNIDVAGCPTTAGCPAYAYKPEASAPAVERLQKAGALMIGKTNLDQFATGLVGTRSPYGACRNVFNRDYISGGSSSGSAVAVAGGMVSFALGTDTAGSGRVPAGFNNIVGLKPTPGIVSTRGVVPACRSLDCVSVFALTCDDATRVLEVMRGYDPADIYARNEEADACRPRQAVKGLRCGIPLATQLEFFGDERARAAFAKSLAVLRDTGAVIVEIDFQPFADAARMLYDGPWVAERFAAVGKFVDEHADAVDPAVRGIIAGAARWSAVDAFDAQYRLRECRRRCEQAWAKMDILALPTAGTHYTLAQIAAEPLQLNRNLGHYTNFVNLLDLCALAVPGPIREDGLPAGITLIAPAHGDELLAAMGARFHRASGVRLGATSFDLPESTPETGLKARTEVVLAVVGAHLSGLPLNHQLTSRGARLLESTFTAPLYRLYALPGSAPPKPGLVRVDSGGAEIEVELWALSVAAFGSFVAEVPPPLAIGTLTLADGRSVKGFVCESWGVDGAPDISHFGGWRAYLAAQAVQQQQQ